MAFLSSSSAIRRLPHSLSLLRRLISTTQPYDPTIRRLARSGKFSDIDSLLKNSLSPETLITNYASAGMIDSAFPLVSTTQTLNSLLSACNHSPTLFRRVPDLFSHFTTTQTLSLTPDHLSYSILIKSLCLSHLRDASREADALRLENAHLRLANADLTLRLRHLVGKPKLEHGREAALEEEFRRLRLTLAYHHTEIMLALVAEPPADGSHHLVCGGERWPVEVATLGKDRGCRGAEGSGLPWSTRCQGRGRQNGCQQVVEVWSFPYGRKKKKKKKKKKRGRRRVDSGNKFSRGLLMSADGKN